MNKRQYKKFLKLQISHLKSDNDLMKRIIANSPAMQELYDRYNQPLKVINIPLRHYRVCKAIAYPDYWEKEVVTQCAAETIAHEMIPLIKGHMSLEDREMALGLNGRNEYRLTFDFWVDESEE